MKRRLTCDVPHCGQPRLRWQRLCEGCYRKLPGEIRVGIATAKHEHRTKDWNALRRRAAEFLNIRPAIAALDAALPRLSAERVFELHQRMLGERTDA